MAVDGYSGLDRFLHRLALQVTPLAELSFDLDQRLVPATRTITNDNHVFVAGLARAGTTILMRRLYAAGGFASLTYRDMPFVLAPNVWGRITRTSGRRVAPTERAHGDGLLVDYDSPEALEEVFWRVFAGDAYLTKTALHPHTPDNALLARFRDYVSAILHARGGAVRYLSKNNNSILRLSGIRRAFPNATILVPFRDPAAHAASLLRQHENFCDQQRHDSFVRDYMTWLGHHEFGLDHRPFTFVADDSHRLSSLDPATIDYWLELWLTVYSWLAEQASADATFVSYEDLCGDPKTWSRLAEQCGVPDATPDAPPFQPSLVSTDITPSPRLAAARRLYDELRDRANRRSPSSSQNREPVIAD